VVLAVMLILKGFLAGMNRQITSYLDNSLSSIVIAVAIHARCITQTNRRNDAGLDYKEDMAFKVQ
jgi:hypothetical protein